ncbi:hypothetical protein BC828DRAFT_371871 [Blastocladiella britannica]|nr:hypothetical protein BC828DRAFT_371871 [Blastocladiella britannica]
MTAETETLMVSDTTDLAPLLVSQRVTATDAVMIRYQLSRPDGSVLSCSHKLLPPKGHLHSPGMGICRGLGAALVGLVPGQTARYRFSGADLTPCHPAVAVDMEQDFADVEIEVLGIDIRAKEPSPDFIDRVNALKAHATAHLASAPLVAIKYYSAAADLLQAVIARPSRTADFAGNALAYRAALLPLRANLAHAYLMAHEPHLADQLARLGLVSVAAGPGSSGVSQTDAALMTAPALVAAAFSAAADSDVTRGLVAKLAFRLARAFELVDKTADAHAVCDAGIAAYCGGDVNAAQAAPFRDLVRKMAAAEKAANAVYTRMFAISPSPSTNEDDKSLEDIDIDQELMPVDPASKDWTDEEKANIASWAGETIETVFPTQSAPVPAAALAASQQNGASGAAVASALAATSSTEWPEDDLPPVNKPLSRFFRPFDPTETEPDSTPAPTIQSIMDAFSSAALHAALSRVYFPHSHYALPSVLVWCSKNCSELRRWLTPWPSLALPLTEALLTRLIVEGNLQIIDGHTNTLQSPQELLELGAHYVAADNAADAEEDTTKKDDAQDKEEPPTQAMLNTAAAAKAEVPRMPLFSMTNASISGPGYKVAVPPHPVVHPPPTPAQVANLLPVDLAPRDPEHQPQPFSANLIVQAKQRINLGMRPGNTYRLDKVVKLLATTMFSRTKNPNDSAWWLVKDFFDAGTIKPLGPYKPPTAPGAYPKVFLPFDFAVGLPAFVRKEDREREEAERAAAAEAIEGGFGISLKRADDVEVPELATTTTTTTTEATTEVTTTTTITTKDPTTNTAEDQQAENAHAAA